MLNKLVRKIFGSRNERLVKRMLKSVEQINALEPALQALERRGLAAKTDEFVNASPKVDDRRSLLNRCSRWCVRPAGGCWACVISTCR